MLLNYFTQTDKNDRMDHLFIVAITVLLSACVRGYTLASTPPHMLRLGVPPPLVGPAQTRVRVTRSSEKSLSCTGPQERRWIPGAPERERDATVGLELCSGIRLFISQAPRPCWSVTRAMCDIRPNLARETNYPNKRDERADLC